MSEPAPAALERLLENHRRFLAFLEPRVGSRAAAEDVLQAAFVRALEKGDALREDESAVAWFYRLLRNALVDRLRRRDDAGEPLPEDAEPAAPEALEREVCACLERLLPALKPEYAEILRRVDLEQRPAAAVAAELGITPGNAHVRLHRARLALRAALERSCRTCATHGCLDCTC